MRLVRLLVCLIVAAALADCAGMPGPQLAAEPPAPPPPATLDGIIYGRAPAAVPVEPAVLPAPVPVLPVPAAVLPGPAPGGDLPYTLDTGDRLRVLVFGQEGLSNVYIIDAAGKVTIPLIGAVSARGLHHHAARARHHRSSAQRLRARAARGEGFASKSTQAHRVANLPTYARQIGITCWQAVAIDCR